MNLDKVIAIDCGGTNLRAAVVDKDMNILAVRRGPTVHDDGEKLFERMKELITEVSEEAHTDIRGIGVSICGVVSHNQVGRCGNLGLELGYDFYSRFVDTYPNAKIRIANDGNCSALVEAYYGVNKGFTDSAFITISSGIGLGIIHNGEMIDLPLEGGRMMIEYNEKLYETEYLCSGKGIVRLCALNGVHVESAAEFFNHVRMNDEKFMRVYNIWLRLLGLWFGNLHILFNCQSYALSGGVIQSADVFLDDLQKVSNASIASWHLNPIRFKIAKFAQDVGICGAACLPLLD